MHLTLVRRDFLKITNTLILLFMNKERKSTKLISNQVANYLTMSQYHLPHIFEVYIDGHWVICWPLTRMKKCEDVNMEYKVRGLRNRNIVRIDSGHALLTQLRLIEKLTIHHSSPCPAGPPMMCPVW